MPSCRINGARDFDEARLDWKRSAVKKRLKPGCTGLRRLERNVAERLDTLDHFAGIGGDHIPFADLAGRRHRPIFVTRHAQVSRVTRITSARVVMPAKALSTPSACIVRMPPSTAAALQLARIRTLEHEAAQRDRS